MHQDFSACRDRATNSPPLRTRRSRLALLAAFGCALAFSAACTESYEGGAACPVLCPKEQAPFKDTILFAVTLDTTVGPFPVLGLSGNALVASRGDTLETYAVVRFDSVPFTFNPNGQSTLDTIRGIDSTFLRLVIDTVGARLVDPFTLEVFDVDTTASDSVSAVVRSLFRADRKVGEIEVPAGALADSLRIPISNAFLLSRMTNRQRVRLGIRIAPGSNAQLRLGAFTGTGGPLLRTDPLGDTLYLPVSVPANTQIAGAESDELLRLSYTIYTLLVRNSATRPAGSLSVGGLPGNRAYFSIAIPRNIADSSTVVRAELLLTQRPSHSVDRGDSIGVQPLFGISTTALSDPYLATALALSARLAFIDSTRLVPSDSGQRAFNIVNIVRSWAGRDSVFSRFVALQINNEGASGAELLFFDRSAPPALRPRIRITYLPRTDFALP